MPIVTPAPPPGARELLRTEKTKQSAHWLAELQTDAGYRTTARVDGCHSQEQLSPSVPAPETATLLLEVSLTHFRLRTAIAVFSALVFGFPLLFSFCKRGYHCVPVMSVTVLELYI